MTATSATSANDTALPERPRPVSDAENEGVGGLALCAQYLWDEKKKQIEEMRVRHEAYLASLPSEPLAAIRLALDELGANDEVPEALERAHHMSVALGALARFGDPFNPSISRPATIYFTEQMEEALAAALAQLRRAQAPLRKAICAV